jgi:chromosome segregation ATPase
MTNSEKYAEKIIEVAYHGFPMVQPKETVLKIVDALLVEHADQQTTSLKAEVEWMKKNIVNAMEWLKLDNNGVALICLENALYNQKDSKIPDAFESLQSQLGMTEIELKHKTTLLDSCEKALEDRDKNIAELKQKLAKAEADKVELFEQLKECTLQIEYLHDKFPKTGTSSSIILKANKVISKHGNNK